MMIGFLALAALPTIATAAKREGAAAAAVSRPGVPLTTAAIGRPGGPGRNGSVRQLVVPPLSKKKTNLWKAGTDAEPGVGRRERKIASRRKKLGAATARTETA
jgi:hypothetical protein